MDVGRLRGVALEFGSDWGDCCRRLNVHGAGGGGGFFVSSVDRVDRLARKMPISIATWGGVDRRFGVWLGGYRRGAAVCGRGGSLLCR